MLCDKKGFLKDLKRRLKRLKSFEKYMPIYQRLSLFRYVLGLCPKDGFGWPHEKIC